ncbi:secretory phospholipase A2 receptor-like, partial [Oscarella lobularis]|uniref:secretory phospholipase A2 receptor-like n=1 Tax=Oscarella lobularis TaxID=121494 RepID=UPI0033142277
MLEVSFRFGEGDDASFDIDCTSNDESLRSCALSNATCNEHIFVSCRSGYGGVKESSFRRRRFSSCFSIRCFRDNDCFSSVRETNGNFGNFNFAITCQDQKWNIRLVNSFGGTKPESESRVEVYFQNAWSVVCDSDWTLSDSIVVCRELGYGQAISRKRRVPAVAGERKIFTYGSRCKGNKTALKDCNLSLSTIQRNDTCQEAVVVCEERENCPIGWFLYAGYCYTLSRSAQNFDYTTWERSAPYCGHSRVSITSSHEHAFLMTLLADFESRGKDIGTYVWIGMVKRERGNQFRWANEDVFSYAMWARGEPTRYGTCVAMNSRTGHWNIVSCKKRRIMICKVALADFDYGARQTDTKKTSKKSCRKDEEQFRKACYYVSKEGKFVASQGQAHRINCRDRGAELASLSSISEHFFIAKESSG